MQGEPTTKVCCACRLERPRGAFSPDQRRPDGLQPRCRDCYNTARNARRLANPERDRARDRARYAASEERRQAVRTAVARQHERDPDYAHRHNLKNYAEHREERQAASRQWYWANVTEAREKSKARTKERCKAHPEQWRGYNQVRRTRLAGGDVEIVDEAKIFERDGWRCQICGKRVPHDAKPRSPLSPSLDHIVPLSKGGHHKPANVRLAHLDCNRRRHTGRRSTDQLLLL